MNSDDLDNLFTDPGVNLSSPATDASKPLAGPVVSDPTTNAPATTGDVPKHDELFPVETIDEKENRLLGRQGKKLDTDVLPEADTDKDNALAAQLWSKVEEARNNRSREDIPIHDEFWERLDEFQLYMNAQESKKGNK